MSHDMTSELESADDSDKNQTTSDTDSDKLAGMTTRNGNVRDGKGLNTVFSCVYFTLM